MNVSSALNFFIGTYTFAGDSQGVYSYRFAADEATWQPQGVVPDERNPAFIALHPERKFLYAVNEIRDADGRRGGAVVAYAYEGHGEFKRLNDQSSLGVGPCHVSVHPSGRYVFTANYGSGSVAMFPVNDDGSLAPASSSVQHEGSSVNPDRQKGPHAHSIICDAAGRFAFAADLGTDKIMIYRLDLTAGQLIPHSQPWVELAPGAGPRHTVFHPNGRFYYVINELDSTVTVFAYDAQAGTLRLLQNISTLPAAYQETNYPADIHIHPTGRFLYGSNRGHDSIVVYSVGEDGLLEVVSHHSTRGEWPRNFAIDPEGTHLIAGNQNTDNIVAFQIDPDRGSLQPVGQSQSVPKPVCIKFHNWF